MKQQMDMVNAAREQLDTAIDLRSQIGSIVGVSTLAAAAYDLTERLCAVHGLISFSDGPMAIIATEFRSGLRNKFSEPQNLWKGARTDPDEPLFFDDEFSDIVILGSSFNLENLGHKASVREAAFRTWVACLHRSYFSAEIAEAYGLHERVDAIAGIAADFSRAGRCKLLRALILQALGSTEEAAQMLGDFLRTCASEAHGRPSIADQMLCHTRPSGRAML
jgi:hypothetical protein